MLETSRSIRLTQTVAAGGWASKLSPVDLEKILSGIELNDNPNVLVGLDQPDDAGIYKLSSKLAIIQTVDFFTPVVDIRIHLDK